MFAMKNLSTRSASRCCCLLLILALAAPLSPVQCVDEKHLANTSSNNNNNNNSKNHVGGLVTTSAPAPSHPAAVTGLPLGTHAPIVHHSSAVTGPITTGAPIAPAHIVAAGAGAGVTPAAHHDAVPAAAAAAAAASASVAPFSAAQRLTAYFEPICQHLGELQPKLMFKIQAQMKQFIEKTAGKMSLCFMQHYSIDPNLTPVNKAQLGTICGSRTLAADAKGSFKSFQTCAGQNWDKNLDSELERISKTRENCLANHAHSRNDSTVHLSHDAINEKEATVITDVLGKVLNGNQAAVSKADIKMVDVGPAAAAANAGKPLSAAGISFGGAGQLPTKEVLNDPNTMVVFVDEPAQKTTTLKPAVLATTVIHGGAAVTLKPLAGHAAAAATAAVVAPATVAPPQVKIAPTLASTVKPSVAPSVAPTIKAAAGVGTHAVVAPTKAAAIVAVAAPATSVAPTAAAAAAAAGAALTHILLTTLAPKPSVALAAAAVTTLKPVVPLVHATTQKPVPVVHATTLKPVPVVSVTPKVAAVSLVATPATTAAPAKASANTTPIAVILGARSGLGDKILSAVSSIEPLFDKKKKSSTSTSTTAKPKGGKGSTTTTAKAKAGGEKKSAARSTTTTTGKPKGGSTPASNTTAKPKAAGSASTAAPAKKSKTAAAASSTAKPAAAVAAEAKNAIKALQLQRAQKTHGAASDAHLHQLEHQRQMALDPVGHTMKHQQYEQKKKAAASASTAAPKKKAA